MNTHIYTNPSDRNQFAVESFTSTDPSKRYTVTLPAVAQFWRGDATCTCPEHQRTEHICKHIMAVVQRIAELAPLRVRQKCGSYYARDTADIHYLVEDRHAWGTLPAARVIAEPDDFVMLIAPPAHDDVVRALLAVEDSFRLRDGVAYALSGECFAVGVDPRAINGHVRAGDDARGRHPRSGVSVFKRDGRDAGPVATLGIVTG